MIIPIQQFMEKSKELVSNWFSQKEERTDLTSDVLNGYLNEMSLCGEKLFDAMAGILSHRLTDQVKFTLSNFVLEVAKVDFKPIFRHLEKWTGVSERDRIVPLTSTEAIGNLFLVLAETDPLSYLVCTTFLKDILKTEKWFSVPFADEDVSKIVVVITGIMEKMSESAMTCLIKEYKTVDEEKERFALTNLQILLETVDTFHEEVREHYSADTNFSRVI